MMSHQARRMLPPGNTRKRKYSAEADKPAEPKPTAPVSSNRLLAGYLAHEFLTKGTLFGKKFDPNSARAESNTSAGSNSAEPNRSHPNSQTPEPTRSSVGKEHETYGEVANVMKMNGTHIKGIVNPTQLSQWMNSM